jgi:hypothetical protein
MRLISWKRSRGKETVYFIPGTVTRTQGKKTITREYGTRKKNKKESSTVTRVEGETLTVTARILGGGWKDWKVRGKRYQMPAKKDRTPLQ